MMSQCANMQPEPAPLVNSLGQKLEECLEWLVTCGGTGLTPSTSQFVVMDLGQPHPEHQGGITKYPSSMPQGQSQHRVIWLSPSSHWRMHRNTWYMHRLSSSNGHIATKLVLCNANHFNNSQFIPNNQPRVTSYHQESKPIPSSETIRQKPPPILTENGRLLSACLSGTGTTGEEGVTHPTKQACSSKPPEWNRPTTCSPHRPPKSSELVTGWTSAKAEPIPSHPCCFCHLSWPNHADVFELFIYCIARNGARI